MKMLRLELKKTKINKTEKGIDVEIQEIIIEEKIALEMLKEYEFYNFNQKEAKLIFLRKKYRENAIGEIAIILRKHE